MTVLSNLIINNYTVSLANNRAKIIAFRDGVELPPQTVQALSLRPVSQTNAASNILLSRAVQPSSEL
jgi:hypothetical protein